MAHIAYIKIDGLLGRDSPVEHYMERDVNVFFGENGCGKTTLLKILDSAMLCDSTIMARLPVTRAVVDIHSIDKEGVIRHIWERVKSDENFERMVYQGDFSRWTDRDRVRFLDHGTRSNPWRRYFNGRSVKEPQVPESWMHSFLASNRLYTVEVLKRIASASLQSEHQLDDAFAENVNRTWLLYYAQVLSEIKKIQGRGLTAMLAYSLSQRAENSGPILDPEQAYSRVKKFILRQGGMELGQLGSAKQFASKYEKDPNLRRVVDNINSLEQEIEVANAPIEKFVGVVGSLLSRGKSLQVREQGLMVALHNGALISAAQLSSGEKHLIRILLAAMTGGPNTVLVDEPELSLHIDWQRSLVKTIHALNPKCQLIFASHSPEVMAELQDNKIFKL